MQYMLPWCAFGGARAPPQRPKRVGPSGERRQHFQAVSRATEPIASAAFSLFALFLLHPEAIGGAQEDAGSGMG